MNISLEYYRIFYHVVKEGSITAAANALCVSQPAVSQTIRQLEAALGVTLFLRAQKGIRLTAEGQTLFQYVERGYETILQGEHALQSMLELETKRAEADKILQDLAAKGAEYEALLLKSEEKQDELLIQLAQKKSTYNRQAYEQWLQNNQEGDAPAYYDDQWLTPLTKYRLTSPFGMRYHPILKRDRMHNGIDMAAAANTPIYAARGGVVITAAYQKDGAGNYVQIDHGDGFRSIYMHMTRYVVAVGDFVAPGQVIGYVGSTGLSTGNHLHFGISKDGKYVNPLEYIPN